MSFRFQIARLVPQGLAVERVVEEAALQAQCVGARPALRSQGRHPADDLA